MNYLLTGEEAYLINQKLQAIIKEQKCDEMNVVFYDATKHELANVINDCNTMPFFSEHKVVVLESCKFLGAGASSIDEKMLLNYLQDPMQATTFILVLNGKVDARKKLVKEINKLCKVMKFNTLEEYDRNNIIHEELTRKGLNIDRDALQLFKQRVGFDMSNIYNELKKLETYGEQVTIEVVEQLVIKPVEDNVFNLTQAIFDQNMKACFEYVQDFKKINVEVIALIALLAGQFRFLSQVKVLHMQGKNKTVIAKELGAHPYRVEKTLENAHRHDYATITKILNELANLDQKIKMGLIDKNLGFEIFLITYCV